MKKILVFTIVSFFLFISSCGSNDVINDENKQTFCWVFTTTTVTSISGASVPGYPQTTTSTTEQCGLTEKQADEVCKKMTSSSSSSTGGITATTKMTTTKKKK